MVAVVRWVCNQFVGIRAGVAWVEDEHIYSELKSSLLQHNRSITAKRTVCADAQQSRHKKDVTV